MNDANRNDGIETGGRRALITGITGQDGSYLAELLLRKGYTVHGIVRRTSNTLRTRLDHLFQDKQVYDKQLFLHYADLNDTATIRRILIRSAPDELYHLAGQSHVGTSFEIPETTCQLTAMGTLSLLEVLRDLTKQPRFLHASTSEIFGRPSESPQDENTPMRPVTPYGVAKTFATQMVQLYRDSFGLFACNAICYNHESPRRGESFVTRKISRAAAAISLGLEDSLSLGSLVGQRDWGYAPEYVDAMWRMLQQPEGQDFVIATGGSNSVEDFLRAAFDSVGLIWQQHVIHDEKFVRRAEVSHLVGNPKQAHDILGWRATTMMPEIARIMVLADRSRLDPSHAVAK